MTQGNDVLLNSNSTNDEKQPDLFADAINAVELGRWFDSVYDTQSACAVCGDDQVIGVRLQKADGSWTVVWIVIDGVRHDAHMHDQFDEFWWERVKAYIGQIPEQVERIVKQGAKHTKGRTLHGVKFEIVSRTRSGDASTKIKNSTCTHLVAREVIEFTEGHAGYAGGAELVETGAYHAKLTAHLKESMGYDVEMSVTEDVSRVDFLSGLFYPIEGRTIWGPKAGKLIPRLGWTCTRVFGHRMWRQLAGTINSFQAYRFIPFVRVYIEHVMTLIPHEFRLTPPTEMRQINTTGITFTQPTADTWAFFQVRYGLSQREEDQFRVELRVATSLPFMLNSAILSILAEVDL